MVISILGGGATGCAVVIAILREVKKQSLRTPVHLRIFEPHGLGKGLAYKDLDHKLLLNTSIGISSILYDDLLHFVHWLEIHKNLWQSRYPEITHYNEDSFLPRSLVGLYIEDVLQQAVASCKSLPVEISYVTEWVEDIECNQSIKIVTNQNQYSSNYCVFCTGYGTGITHTYSHLLSQPNYYASPYLYEQQIKQIPKNKRVLILGTGLSAIDTVLLLEDHSDIVMISRNGKLPCVRNRLIATTPLYLTEAEISNFIRDKPSVQKVRGAIEKELSLVYGKKIDLDQVTFLSDPVEQLKLDLDAAKNRTNLWEDSIFTCMRFIMAVWPHFSTVDKKQFLQKNRSLILRYVSSFPYETAKLIESRIASKRLSIQRGIQSVDYKKGRFEVILSANNHVYKEDFDYVINATPISGRVQDSSCVVYHKMFDRGLLQENYLGGMKVGENFQLKNNTPDEHRLYAAGPVIDGEFPFTNLLYSCGRQAQVIAQDLCNKIGFM